MVIDRDWLYAGWIGFAGNTRNKPDLARQRYPGGSGIINSVGFLLASMADCRCADQSGCVCRAGTALAKITIFLMEESHESH